MEMVPVWALVCALGVLLGDVDAHGYLQDPPARTLPVIAMQKNLPGYRRDYNYNQLFCGGREVQWNPAGNNGRCGVCGDNWADAEPRDHEEGGKYVGHTTIIAKEYSTGQAIDVTVKITANHKGYFEFRLCERDSTNKKLDHACLNQHLLRHPTTGNTTFSAGTVAAEIHLRVQLPPGVNCQYCVLQWKYITGNDWGVCADGVGRLGCSKTPEQFYSCADIRIKSGGSGTGSGGSGSSGGSGGSGGSGSSGGGGGAGGSSSSECPGCKGIGLWRTKKMEDWCCRNCQHNPSFCPSNMCSQDCLPSV